MVVFAISPALLVPIRSCGGAFCVNKDSVIESARQFGDDLQELIAAIENNDSTVGLAHLRNAVQKNLNEDKWS